MNSKLKSVGAVIALGLALAACSEEKKGDKVSDFKAELVAQKSLAKALGNLQDEDGIEVTADKALLNSVAEKTTEKLKAMYLKEYSITLTETAVESTKKIVTEELYSAFAVENESPYSGQAGSGYGQSGSGYDKN